MKMRANEILKISPGNPDTSYLVIENTDPTLTNILYLLDREPADIEDIIDNGIQIGGLGFFELQAMNMRTAAKSLYGYTSVSGLDIRVLRL
ncbi:MAG: hypothetical protein PHP18_05680 [Bacilli bacterium]|nr:hypothetical protein [Bacilli bacterium]